jgi:hypothetical protein
MSSPDLTGRSSNPSGIDETFVGAQIEVWWLLDRPVEPGDDNCGI